MLRVGASSLTSVKNLSSVAMISLASSVRSSGSLMGGLSVFNTGLAAGVDLVIYDGRISFIT